MSPHSAQIMRSRLSPSGTPRTDGPRPVSASAIMAGIIGTAPGGDKEPGCTPRRASPPRKRGSTASDGTVAAGFPLARERRERVGALRRHRDGALVVHDLADPGA